MSMPAPHQPPSEDPSGQGVGQLPTPGGRSPAWYIRPVSEGRRNYSDEEVEEIFRRALERQAADGDGFAHDELIAAAHEVGLDDDAIDRAVRELEHDRTEASIRDRVAKRKRERWLRHLFTYLVVAGGFLGMHALGYVGVWAIWMAFGWGMGVALQTFSTLRGPTEEEVEKERKKLNRKARRAARAKARAEAKRRKAEARARRSQRKQQRGQIEDELERVIEDGVSLLLSAAAKKLREATERAEPAPPRTDFERFVRAKKEGRSTDAYAKERPRVRVEAEVDSREGETISEESERRERGRRRRR